jgi:rubredoxin
MANGIDKTYEGITMKTYQCVVCGFIYDEAAGLPGEGIAAGTRWDDIPANWECPDCGVARLISTWWKSDPLSAQA